MTFSTGKEFDASWDRGQPFPVTLGATGDRGLDQGLVGMREGRTAHAHDPARAGLRPDGYPPAIAPNETLVFVVDAVSVR